MIRTSVFKSPSKPWSSQHTLTKTVSTTKWNWNNTVSKQFWNYFEIVFKLFCIILSCEQFTGHFTIHDMAAACSRAQNPKQKNLCCEVWLFVGTKEVILYKRWRRQLIKVRRRDPQTCDETRVRVLQLSARCDNSRLLLMGAALTDVTARVVNNRCPSGMSL